MNFSFLYHDHAIILPAGKSDPVVCHSIGRYNDLDRDTDLIGDSLTPITPGRHHHPITPHSTGTDFRKSLGLNLGGAAFSENGEPSCIAQQSSALSSSLAGPAQNSTQKGPKSVQATFETTSGGEIGRESSPSVYCPGSSYRLSISVQRKVPRRMMAELKLQGLK